MYVLQAWLSDVQGSCFYVKVLLNLLLIVMIKSFFEKPTTTKNSGDASAALNPHVSRQFKSCKSQNGNFPRLD